MAKDSSSPTPPVMYAMSPCIWVLGDWPYMLIGVLINMIAITIATTIKIALIMGELMMFIFFIRLSHL